MVHDALKNLKRRAGIKNQKQGAGWRQDASRSREPSKEKAIEDKDIQALRKKEKETLSKQQKAFTQVADDFVFLLEEYQEIYDLPRSRFVDLPLAYHVDILLASSPDVWALWGVTSMSEFLIPVEKGCTIEQSLCHRVKGVFTAVGEDSRINGTLAHISQNEEMMLELVDLLIISQSHPSRIDIVGLEKEANDNSTVVRRMSALTEKIVLCQMPMISIDVFLEYLSKQSAGRSVLRMPALDKIIGEVFLVIDVDGDGECSQEESQELIRCFLSRPMMGKLMTVMVSADPVNSSFSDILPSLVPECVRKMANDVVSMSQNFWNLIDADHNSIVPEDEFTSNLLNAFLNAVALPLVSKLAEMGKRAHQARTLVSRTKDKLTNWAACLEECASDRNTGNRNAGDQRDCSGCSGVNPLGVCVESAKDDGQPGKNTGKSPTKMVGWKNAEDPSEKDRLFRPVEFKPLEQGREDDSHVQHTLTCIPGCNTVNNVTCNSGKCETEIVCHSVSEEQKIQQKTKVAQLTREANLVLM